MSEVRGQKGFEGPSEQELEDYIKQSRKSITRMQRGNPPLFFRPKKNRTKVIIGIVFLLVIPTAFLSIASLMSNYPSANNNNTTGTTDTHTIEPTSLTTTQIPEELDTEEITRKLEDFIDEMISPNHSIIHPVMIDSSINASRLISDSELFDLIWYLSQFETGSKWWIIGRELLFEKFPLWNESYSNGEDSDLQIKALRSYLVYTPDEIPLDTKNLAVFHNKCKLLWSNITPKIDNLTSTLEESPDSSSRLAMDQILFLEFLSKAVNFPSLFEQAMVSDYARNAIDTIVEISNRTNGIPEYFDINSSHSSSLFWCKHQGKLILALNQLNIAFDVASSVNLLIDRLNKFLINHLLNEDWSYSEYYNSSNRKQSDNILASDLGLIIRCNVLLEHLRYGEYISGALFEEFEAPNSGFYHSSKDQNSQYLIDQVLILLAFQDLVMLESKMYPPTEPTAGASWSLGVLIVIFSLSFIMIKRKWLDRKLSSKK